MLTATMIYPSCKKEVLQNDITGFFSKKAKEGFLEAKHPNLGTVFVDTTKILNEAHIDNEDKVINLAQHRLMHQILNSTEKRSILKFAVKEAKASNSNTISWNELIKKFPNLGEQSPQSYSSSCTYAHNGYLYEPELFLANADWANENLEEILSDGIEIEDDYENENHDLILGYLSSDSAQNSPIIIGDSSYKAITNPILVMSLSYCGIDSSANLALKPNVNMNGSTVDRDGSKLSNPRNASGTSSYEYRINHRYDQSNYSEWCMVFFEAKPNGQNPAQLSIGSRNLAKVHKNDIGKDLSKWIHWTTLEPLGNCSSTSEIEFFGFGYNTYEHDWYQSKKDLGSSKMRIIGVQLLAKYSFPPSFIVDQRPLSVEVVSSGDGAFGGKRKYLDEWYSFHPHFAHTPGQDLNYTRIPYFQDQCWGNSYWKHTQEFQENKGYISFWKIVN
jgi:hypothetical protein